MKRIVEPELLDELPTNDPRAIQSRCDLRRVNWFMGNVGIIQRNLEKSLSGKPLKTLVELGAGDGTFLLRLAQSLAPRWENVKVTFVDQQRLVSAESERAFQQLGWSTEIICADIFDWLPKCPPADGMIANLFLHHFEDEKLSELLRLVSNRTNAFVACEPRRTGVAVWGTKLLRLLGCNDVTRHDATVSVRAGFRANDLSKLWPEHEKWKIEESETGLFSHVFVAVNSSEFRQTR